MGAPNNEFDFRELKLNFDLNVGTEGYDSCEKSFCFEKQKTETSSINSHEKSETNAKAIKTTLRKVSIFSSDKRDKSSHRRVSDGRRDNSYDQLARTFGFNFSINTCCMSDSDYQEGEPEE